MRSMRKERKLLKIFSLHINSAMMWAWFVLISSLKPASIYWFSSPIEFHKIAVECSVEHAVCCFLFLLSFCFKDLAGVVQVHVMAFLKVAGNWNSYRMYVCAEIIDALVSCGGILAIFLWSRSLARLLYSITQLCTFLCFVARSNKKETTFLLFSSHSHQIVIIVRMCTLSLSVQSLLSYAKRVPFAVHLAVLHCRPIILLESATWFGASLLLHQFPSISPPCAFWISFLFSLFTIQLFHFNHVYYRRHLHLIIIFYGWRCFVFIHKFCAIFSHFNWIKWWFLMFVNRSLFHFFRFVSFYLHLTVCCYWDHK